MGWYQRRVHGDSSRDQHSNNNQQPRPLKMKSFATLVLLNFALARPDHGVLHHGAHHTVHHQPAAVHHSAVHHQPVHHQHVAPVVAKAAPKTIAELVVSEPRFSTLLAAVKAADLVETLSGEGSFTVFAPTN